MDTDDDKSVRITENDLPQEFILKLLGQYEARGLWGIKHTREPVDAMVRYAKTHELSLPIVQVIVTKEGIFMSPIQCRLDNRTGGNIAVRKLQTRHNSDRRFGCANQPATETWNEGEVTKPRVTPSTIAQALLKQMKENYGDCEKGKTAECNTRKDRLNCFAKQKSEVVGSPTNLDLLARYTNFDWKKSGIFFFGIDTISYGVQDLIYTRVFSMIVITDRKKRNLDRNSSPFMCHAFVCESRNTARRVTYALAAAFQAYGRSMKCIRQPQYCPRRHCCEDKPRKLTIELGPEGYGGLNDSEA